MLRKLRITLEILFFLCITALLLDFTGVLHQYLGWMAKIQLLPAILAVNVGVVVALLLLTFVFGRLYCSVICPLGVMQDGFSWIGGKMKKNRFQFRKAHNLLRWVVLGIFAVLMILGLNSVAILIAPYSAYGRIVVSVFQPVYMWINNLLALLSERMGNYAFYTAEVWVKSAITMAVSLITLVVIGFLSLKNGRVWCNNICPVGTLLGFVSRFSILAPKINVEKCNGCTKCAKNCKSSCINPQEHSIDYSRCVACMDCLNNCKQGAISYGLRTKKAESSAEEIDESKRKFIATAAFTSVALAADAQGKKIDGGLAVIEDKKPVERNTPLKPAGSVSFKHFSSHCTACQLCVSECPNGLLSPSSKLSNLMQPEMSFDRGYCRPECTSCSEVCPAGAIKKVTPAEKSAIHIGYAVWVRENCLMPKGESCAMCVQKCPSEAVRLVKDPSSGHMVPSVDENRCIGCGACEYFCPSRPLGGIYVEGREVHINEN